MYKTLIRTILVQKLPLSFAVVVPVCINGIVYVVDTNVIPTMIRYHSDNRHVTRGCEP